MSLADNLKKSGTLKREPSVWTGPCGEGKNGGISFSLTSSYLSCKERFRIRVMEGLRAADEFLHRRDYGSLWHACEEGYAARSRGTALDKNYPLWHEKLQAYASLLCRKYPTAQEAIDHWYNVAKIQFPLYVRFWEKHRDQQERIPLLQESVFDVPYILPSGRVVRLRGKWDSVDLLGDRSSKSIFLMENKTKGEIREGQIKKQLARDAQTMLYLVTLQEYRQNMTVDLVKTVRGEGDYPEGYSDNEVTRDILIEKRIPLAGVIYNVVRRPLSGGKGSIVRHKPSKSNPAGESKEAFYKRLAEYMEEEPEMYFMRWQVTISQQDIARFKRECLEPILENLCDDYEWWETCHKGKKKLWDCKERMRYFPDHCPRHFTMPYGVFSPLLDNGTTELDDYLASGSRVGLERVENLFPELQE